LTYFKKTSIKSLLTKIRCTVAPPSGRDSSKCGDFLMRLRFQKRSALESVSRIIPERSAGEMRLEFQKRSELKFVSRIILQSGGRETQASETKCSEACRSNYREVQGISRL